MVSSLSRIGAEEDNSSLADDPVEMSEQGHAYIKRLGIACSAICSTNHCYQLVTRILIILRARNLLVNLWKGDLSHSKVYEGPLSYAEGKPFDFMKSFYSAL